MMQRAPTAADAKIGLRLRAFRMEKKISQDELGGAIGVSFQQIQKYEKGVNRIGADRLVQIASALGVSTQSLLGVSETEAINPGALTMLASREGARLAQAFNEITNVNDRKQIADLAERFAKIDQRFTQAAE